MSRVSLCDASESVNVVLNSEQQQLRGIELCTRIVYNRALYKVIPLANRQRARSGKWYRGRRSRRQG